MAGDTLSEQEIQFRKRARRRLVGAIALVLLMVTILPMVLDDQGPAAPQQEIAISIPSQEGGDFTSKIVPAEVPAAGSEASPSQPLPELAAPVAPQPAPAAPEASVPPAAPVAAAKPEPVKKAEPAASAPKPDVAVPAAEKAPVEKAGSVKSGFSVQIGVFSDAAKVKQLQAKLKAQGVTTYTEKLGNKIRLRSGPFDSRPEAEKVQAKLKTMNMATIVVANK